MNYLNFKYFFDRVIALLLLILLFPILAIIALCIKFSSVKQVFFIHQRPGLNTQPFNLIKFKTMNDKKDKTGILLPNKERITPLGAFLRKTSLDEIPQLINVLKGDISFIGPRPLEMRYLPLYTKKQNLRHTVKPGISGWAQVNGRNAISWEKKFELDLFYVQNVSFSLDLKIFFLTLQKVIIGSGVNANDTQTVEPLDVYLKNKNGI
jgi:lipopolysaccharide/colanic/teichoic acid biosynthesis glycosyltransferase